RRLPRPPRWSFVNDTEPRRWPIGRQIIVGYVVILVLTALSAPIGVVALRDLRDANIRVLDKDVRRVSGADELEGVLALRAVIGRTILIDGTRDRVDRLQEQITTAEELLDELHRVAVTDTGRRYLEQIEEELAVWNDLTDQAISAL